MLNYMSLGLPVVAYDTPVHREYLGEFGRYVPPADITGLAQAIEKLISQPEQRIQLGQALRKRAIDNFTWPAAAKQIDTIYTQHL